MEFRSNAKHTSTPTETHETDHQYSEDLDLSPSNASVLLWGISSGSEVSRSEESALTHPKEQEPLSPLPYAGVTAPDLQYHNPEHPQSIDAIIQQTTIANAAALRLTFLDLLSTQAAQMKSDWDAERKANNARHDAEKREQRAERDAERREEAAASNAKMEALLELSAQVKREGDEERRVETAKRDAEAKVEAAKRDAETKTQFEHSEQQERKRDEERREEKDERDSERKVRDAERKAWDEEKVDRALEKDAFFQHITALEESSAAESAKHQAERSEYERLAMLEQADLRQQLAALHVKMAVLEAQGAVLQGEHSEVVERLRMLETWAFSAVSYLFSALLLHNN